MPWGALFELRWWRLHCGGECSIILVIYSFLHSLVSSFRDLTGDFILILLWILRFLHAQDTHFVSGGSDDTLVGC